MSGNKKVDENSIKDFTQFIDLDGIFKFTKEESKPSESKGIQLVSDFSAVFEDIKKRHGSTGELEPAKTEVVSKDKADGKKDKSEAVSKDKSTNKKDKSKVVENKNKKEEGKGKAPSHSKERTKPLKVKEKKFKNTEQEKRVKYEVGTEVGKKTGLGQAKKGDVLNTIKSKEFIIGFIGIILTLMLGLGSNYFIKANAIKVVDGKEVNMYESVETDPTLADAYTYEVRFSNMSDKPYYIRFAVDVEGEEDLAWITDYLSESWYYIDGYIYFDSQLTKYGSTSNAFNGLKITEDNIVKGLNKKIGVSKAEYIIGTFNSSPVEAFKECE